MKYPYHILLTLLVLIVCLNYTCKINTPDVQNNQASICSELSGSAYVPVALSEIVCIAKNPQGVLYVVR